MNKALIAENSIFTRRGRSSERSGPGHNESRSRLQHAASGGAPTARTALTVAESEAEFPNSNNAIHLTHGDAVAMNSKQNDAALSNKHNNEGIVCSLFS